MSHPAGSIPNEVRDLTPEFFSWVLGEAGLVAEARVVSVSCLPIGDRRGFVSSAYRCVLAYDMEEESAPEQVVAKFRIEGSLRRQLFEQYGVYEREARFYDDLGEETRRYVPVPRCYFSAYQASAGPFLLLLEDLAPGVPGDGLKGLSVEEAREAVSVVARMHAGWWQNERLNGLGWLPSPNGERTKRMVQEDYPGVWASFEEDHGGNLPASVRALGRELCLRLSSVLDRLSSPPFTLVHGDYQLANIFFGPAGGVSGVIDWQVALKGRGPIDLAHLLVRSLSPEDRRSAEDDLVRHYHAALTRHGVNDYPIEECWEDYRLAVIYEFGLGLVFSSVLAKAARPSEGEIAPDREALSRVGAGRFFAALVDLEWDTVMSSLPGRRGSPLRRALKAALGRRRL